MTEITLDKLNSVYTERMICVCLLAKLSQRLGYEVVVRPAKEAEWAVIYIQLPEGQLSWHISDHDMHLFESFPISENAQWDGTWNGRNPEFVKGITV
ncbi:hypothetical protein [Dyadobacter sp. CY356]|uniref:WDGH domain-containing protein n=1 Tax=Dyadobacter sp. CY356 TaxID=2906442 RepID=UPI001F15B498|nr:hypothetical protein [Dyadobacter sp. CY356]MCF0055533.1 hypothetical protein [Dyadobacter sp. CY356]